MISQRADRAVECASPEQLNRLAADIAKTETIPASVWNAHRRVRDAVGPKPRVMIGLDTDSIERKGMKCEWQVDILHPDRNERWVLGSGQSLGMAADDALLQWSKLYDKDLKPIPDTLPERMGACVAKIDAHVAPQIPEESERFDEFTGGFEVPHA